VPNADDVVLVPAGVTLDVAADDYPITVQELINRGVIRLAGDGVQPARLEIAGLLDNSGQILGGDGAAPGAAGVSVEVTAATVLNTGVIRGGAGADGGGAGGGAPDGGAGGAVRVFGQAIDNRGEISGGEGGAGDAGAGGEDGRGGAALLVAEPGASAFLANSGTIAGGDSRGDQPGGDVVVLSSGTLVVDGGEQRAGSGANGAAGSAFVSGNTTWLNGVLGRGGSGYNFTFYTPIAVQGPAGGSVPLRLLFINRGGSSDRYYLSWSNSAGWPISGLPALIDVRGLSVLRLPLGLALPAGLPVDSRSVLQVVATSQGNPALVETHTVVVLVVDAQAGQRLLLPLVLGNAAPAAAVVSGAAEDAGERPSAEAPSGAPQPEGTAAGDDSPPVDTAPAAEAFVNHVFLPLVVQRVDLAAQGSD
jgi:hypothetical protein